LATARVLDVGQCDRDHRAIAALIEAHFAATVDRADLVRAAYDALAQRPYDLVLVNRQIAADETDGLQLVRLMKQHPDLSAVPVMLVSNLAEAQERAVAEGAVLGFGKAALDSPETLARLAQYLPRRAGG